MSIFGRPASARCFSKTRTHDLCASTPDTFRGVVRASWLRSATESPVENRREQCINLSSGFGLQSLQDLGLPPKAIEVIDDSMLFLGRRKHESESPECADVQMGRCGTRDVRTYLILEEQWRQELVQKELRYDLPLIWP
jgi:hypothetical protein